MVLWKLTRRRVVAAVAVAVAVAVAANVLIRASTSLTLPLLDHLHKPGEGVTKVVLKEVPHSSRLVPLPIPQHCSRRRHLKTMGGGTRLPSGPCVRA